MALGLEGITLITIIQSILLIISALLILIATIGILRMDKDMPNVVYARIHVLGMIDVAGIIAFLALGQPLFALIYLFLAPLLAHALANAFFHGEDDYNNPVLNPNLLNEESDNLDEASKEEPNISEDDSEDSDNLDESVDLNDSDNLDEESSEEDSNIEDVDNETTEEKDEENLNNSEGDDND